MTTLYKSIIALGLLYLTSTQLWCQTNGVLYTYDEYGRRKGREYVTNLYCQAAKSALVLDTTGLKPDESIASIEESIKVFPNPTNGDLYISIADDLAEGAYIEVLSLSGNVLLSQPFPVEGTPVDVCSLVQGAYILRIRTQTATTIKRIIKK